MHESLKNVILVMHAAGMLVPSADEHGESRNDGPGQLWHVTHDKIERFMPGFMETVIPLSTAAETPETNVAQTVTELQ